MHPRIHAKHKPDAVATVMGPTGDTMTFAQLEDRANQGAQLFRSLGLKAGDVIAVWLQNGLQYFEICWAAQRSGIYFVPVPVHLTAVEASYMVNDSGAQVVITSAQVKAASDFVDQREGALDGEVKVYSLGAQFGALEDWHLARASMPSERIADETSGGPHFYSSGTTGLPKGIKPQLSGAPADSAFPWVATMQKYGLDERSVVLNMGPLYHTTPLITVMTSQAIGATAVITDRFNPEQLLEFIERYRVTYASLVPTMFVRLLKLDKSLRERYDHSSLKCVHHMAAPCPKQVKHDMIKWWGPILHETYAGTESIGSTTISAEEWLRKPGSVGKADWGELHICDDEGVELPPGEVGTVYFSGGFDFEYHNDKEKSQEARNPLHSNWKTLGDVGYVDEDGYLFLTDRRKFTIVSGGVNIYPAEAEEILITHPKVTDVAVIGVPNAEYGEEVKAVVQPADWNDAGPELEQELIAFCRGKLSHVKCPKSIDFDRALPRYDNGKLYKQKVKARYWEGRESSII